MIKKKVSNPKDGERGMIVILMAVAIVALIGAGSLAVDIGSALVTKSELQNVADASSLAATRELAIVYKEKTAINPNLDLSTVSIEGDLARIQAKALAFAAANKAGGLSINVGTGDIVTATYDVVTGAIKPATAGVRAVKVTGRRDDTQNGQIQTALSRVLGINQLAVTAESTAAISALGSLRSGMGEFPIGLDEDWFKTHNCASPENVVLYPTSPGSCAGWHTFDSKPSSASKLKTIVKGIEHGTFQSPVTIADKTVYQFVGGTITSAMDDLVELWDQKKSGSPPTWTVNVPVYASNGCVNVQGPNLIVGFAKFKVTQVKKNPDGAIDGDVECGIFDGNEVGDGGGPNDFGALVGTPGMIN